MWHFANLLPLYGFLFSLLYKESMITEIYEPDIYKILTWPRVRSHINFTPKFRVIYQSFATSPRWTGLKLACYMRPIHHSLTRLEFVTEVNVGIDFFWDMRPCSLVRVTCTCMDIPITIFAPTSSVTSVHMYQSTRLHISHDRHDCHYLFSRGFVALEHFLGQQNFQELRSCLLIVTLISCGKTVFFHKWLFNSWLTNKSF